MPEETLETTDPHEKAVIDKLQPVVTLIGAMGPVIGIFNFLSQIVAGIWLAVLGEWGAILAGLGFGLCGNWLLGFALMPSLIFTPIQASAIKNGDKGLLHLSTVLTMGYTMLIASIWCSWAFSHFVHMTHSAAIIPSTFWAYSVATTPWVTMASKERDNISTLIGALFIQIAAMILVAGFLFFHFSYGTAFTVSACFLIACAFYQASLAMKMMALSPENY